MFRELNPHLNKNNHPRSAAQGKYLGVWCIFLVTGTSGALQLLHNRVKYRRVFGPYTFDPNNPFYYPGESFAPAFVVDSLHACPALSDWLEEQGRDDDATLLREVYAAHTTSTVTQE